MNDERSASSGPSARLEHLNRFLEHVAGGLTSVVAVLLLCFVVVALVGVVADTWGPVFHDRNMSEGALRGLDEALLAIILLELAFTTLARGPVLLQLQQFLVIGVTSAVRVALEVAAGARTSQSPVVALVLDAVAVFVLVVALLLVRRRMSAEQTTPGRGA
jgi:hypothetical protein